MQGWVSGRVKFQTDLRKSELSSSVVPVVRLEMLVLLTSVLSGWCVNQQVNFYRVRLVCVFFWAFCLIFNSSNDNQTSHIIHISGNMKEVFLLEAFSPGQGKAALLWFSNTLTQTIHVSRARSWSRRQSGFKAVGYCDDISSIVSLALFCTRCSVDFFPQIMTSSRLFTKPARRLGSPVTQPSCSVWASVQRRQHLCFSKPTLNIRPITQ